MLDGLKRKITFSQSKKLSAVGVFLVSFSLNELLHNFVFDVV